MALTVHRKETTALTMASTLRVFHGQDSKNIRLTTPALPMCSSSPTWHASAKSGLTTSKTASTNGCPLEAAGLATMTLDPAMCTGAKHGWKGDWLYGSYQTKKTRTNAYLERYRETHGTKNKEEGRRQTDHKCYKAGWNHKHCHQGNQGSMLGLLVKGVMQKE